MEEISDELFAHAFHQFQKENFWRICELRIADLTVHTFCRNKQLVFDRKGLRPIDVLSIEFGQIYNTGDIAVHEVDLIRQISAAEFESAMKLIKEVIHAESKRMDRKPDRHTNARSA